ncbi:MAG: AAA family ATPase [Myxococcota bacterium]
MSNHIDIVIVTALKREFDALREVETGRLEAWTEVLGDPPYWRTSFAGDNGPLEVAAARMTRMGGVATASIAHQLVTRLRPSCLAMCGVCAGHPANTDLGDVIIPDRIFEYDSGKQILDGFQGDLWVHAMRDNWFRVAQNLEGPAHGLYGYAEPDDEIARWWFLDRLLSENGVVHDPLQSVALHRYIPDVRRADILAKLLDLDFININNGSVELTEHGIEAVQRHRILHGTLVTSRPYHIHVGPLASGNSVVSDGEIWRRLHQGMRKVIGLDMEAATIATVAHQNAIPFAVAKGVIDHADAKRSDRFNTFAARTSAEVLTTFLRKVVDGDRKSIQSTRVSATSSRVRALRLKLSNIRCFEDLEVEFGRDGAPTDWTLVLGNNGAGKSTLLRAIAIGLAPEKELGAMLHADGNGWSGPAGSTGQIDLTLSVDGRELTRTVRITSTSRSSTFTVAGTASAVLDEQPLLLAGYGAARQLLGTKEIGSYSRYDSTSTLMSPNGSLQNPELAVRRAVTDDSDPSSLLARLDRILMLDIGSTTLDFTGLGVRDPNGERHPLTRLSDGFRGTLSWVLDLIGWQVMALEAYGLTKLPTIIILDELEQHLHPQWQRAVISRLREQFPDAQFIVSTHAPLCVAGSSDLDDEDISLLHLGQEYDADGRAHITAHYGMRPPRDLRADQILTSYLFGLSSARTRDVQSKIIELSRLHSLSAPSPEERTKALTLQRELQPLLGSGETALEREVQQAALQAATAVIARDLGTLAPEQRQQLFNLSQTTPDPSEN